MFVIKTFQTILLLVLLVNERNHNSHQPHDGKESLTFHVHTLLVLLFCSYEYSCVNNHNRQNSVVQLHHKYLIIEIDIFPLTCYFAPPHHFLSSFSFSFSSLSVLHPFATHHHHVSAPPAGDPDEENGHRGVQRDHKDLRGAVSDSGALQQGVHREVPSRGQREGDPEVGRHRGNGDTDLQKAHALYEGGPPPPPPPRGKNTCS